MFHEKVTWLHVALATFKNIVCERYIIAIHGHTRLITITDTSSQDLFLRLLSLKNGQQTNTAISNFPSCEVESDSSNIRFHRLGFSC